MFSKQQGQVIVLRLESGEDLFSSLKETAEKHQVCAGLVLSGIGMLENVELGYFMGTDQGYRIHKFAEACELTSLSGNISRQLEGYNIHLHANIARPDGNVSGGHLIKGTVYITNEIFIFETGIPLFRRKEPTGLVGLYLD